MKRLQNLSLVIYTANLRLHTVCLILSHAPSLHTRLTSQPQAVAVMI